jgi:hypothetical protein
MKTFLFRSIFIELVSILGVGALLGVQQSSIFAQNQPQVKNWILNCNYSYSDENRVFTFPNEGFAYDHRDSVISVCYKAIEHNINILNEKEFKDTINVVIVRTRDEMKQMTGSKASGMALSFMKKVFLIIGNNDVEPPINHELMHLISETLWGYPAIGMTFLDEGLATYARNNCNNYTVEDIYAYLQFHNMLIPIDSLVVDFYKRPEMVAYHQSAYIVQYLLMKYGAGKLKMLWQSGFTDFQKIYGIAFKTVERNIEEEIKQKYPIPPNIDWESFSKGCK